MPLRKAHSLWLTSPLFRLQLYHERKDNLFKPLQPPVRSRIFECIHCRNHIGGVPNLIREIVRLSSFRKVRAGKQPHCFTQRDNTFLFDLLETLPITKMFFRPEEVHRASRVLHIALPFPNGYGNMADQPFWVLRLDLAVLHLKCYGLSTVEAHGIDSYCLSREQPADRQRFKGSLAEPLLFIVNSQAVVVRGIVEGCK
jgi:hypothetical protein